MANEIKKTREGFLKYRQIERDFEKGKFDEIDFFLKYSAIHAINYALEWTAFYGKLDLVKKVIEANPDIHANNDIALQMACENNHIPVVEYLLSVGANINAMNGAPLCRAVLKYHEELVKYLLEYQDSNGVKICDPTLNRNMALRFAVDNNSESITKLLIAHGADKHVFDDHLSTLAKNKKYTKILEILTEPN